MTLHDDLGRLADTWMTTHPNDKVRRKALAGDMARLIRQIVTDAERERPFHDGSPVGSDISLACVMLEWDRIVPVWNITVAPSDVDEIAQAFSILHQSIDANTKTLSPTDPSHASRLRSHFQRAIDTLQSSIDEHTERLVDNVTVNNYIMKPTKVVDTTDYIGGIERLYAFRTAKPPSRWR